MIDVKEINDLAVDMNESSALAAVEVLTILAETAKEIRSTGRHLAPRVTGHLARSISFTIDKTQLAAEIGPTAWYAHFVEGGTSHSPPHAFMGPALDQHTPDFVRRLVELQAVERLGRG